MCGALYVGNVTAAPSCAPQSPPSRSPVHMGSIYLCTSQGSADSHIVVLSKGSPSRLQTLHTFTFMNSHPISCETPTPARSCLHEPSCHTFAQVPAGPARVGASSDHTTPRVSCPPLSWYQDFHRSISLGPIQNMYVHAHMHVTVYMRQSKNFKK